MFNCIENNAVLFWISRGECCENGMGVGFDAELCIGDQVNDELVKILKLDAYYNTKDFATPPKSIDCLILVKGVSGSYSIYLVELRGVNSTKGVRPEEIKEKFDTAIYDFMSDKFKNLFVDFSYDLKVLKLWLVTDPLMCKGMTEEEYNKKIKGTVLGRYESFKPYRFRDKYAVIVPKLPGVSIGL